MEWNAPIACLLKYAVLKWDLKLRETPNWQDDE